MSHENTNTANESMSAAEKRDDQKNQNNTYKQIGTVPSVGPKLAAPTFPVEVGDVRHIHDGDRRRMWRSKERRMREEKSSIVVGEEEEEEGKSSSSLRELLSAASELHTQSAPNNPNRQLNRATTEPSFQTSPCVFPWTAGRSGEMISTLSLLPALLVCG